MVLATASPTAGSTFPELDALTGAGVFYGASASEAQGLEGADVYLVGGGNSAGQAALHLARHARRVVLVVRAPTLGAGMSDYLSRRSRGSQHRGALRRRGVGGGGDGRLEYVVVRDGDRASRARSPPRRCSS